MDLVRSTIHRYVTLSDAEWQRIAPLWHERAFSKGAYICATGEVEEWFYIVKSGVQRLSFFHDGNDVCVGFAYDGSWCGEYASFVSRKPARFDVKAVTDTVLIGIRHDDPDAAKRPLIVEVDPRSPRAEAFRVLRTNLQFVDAAAHPRTIVVTSSLAGEGKSTMAANLALTMAQAGSRVCLIEADLRRPKVLEYMGLEGGVGLTDALIGRTDVIDVIQPYGGTNLWVLGAGPIPPNPSELLGSTAMRSLLGHLSSRFDYVVIDAPPALPVTDAVVISKLVDGAIVVAGSGMVERDQLALTLESLESVNGNVLGIVLNRLPAKQSQQYGGYPYAIPEEESTRSERKRVEPV